MRTLQGLIRAVDKLVYNMCIEQVSAAQPRRGITLSFMVFVLTVFSFVGCQRDQGVLLQNLRVHKRSSSYAVFDRVQIVQQPLTDLTEFATHQILSQIITDLSVLPLQQDGWRLVKASCELYQKTVWECHSDYFRYRLEANDLQFQASIPLEWRPSWRAFNGVHAHFLLSRTIPKVHVNSWITMPQREVQALAQVHHNAARLPTIRLNQRSEGAMFLLAPKDMHGLTHHLKDISFFGRPVILDASLNSLATISPSMWKSMVWHKISIEYAPDNVINLRAGQLIARLEGVIYALDE